MNAMKFENKASKHLLVEERRNPITLGLRPPAFNFSRITACSNGLLEQSPTVLSGTVSDASS